MKHLLIVLGFTVGLFGQVADKANERYRTPQGRAGMLATLGAPDRAERIQFPQLAQELEIRPGQTVADLGTGAGALLPFLSQAAGNLGVVYAEDIFDDFLTVAKKKAEGAGLANVRFVKGTERNVNLPEKAIDLAVTVDAYHHFDYPGDVLTSIKKSLKPGGRFAIVDYYKRAGAMGGSADAVEHIRIDKPEVIKEVTSFGWKLLEQRDHVADKQYILVFTPAE